MSIILPGPDGETGTADDVVVPLDDDSSSSSSSSSGPSPEDQRRPYTELLLALHLSPGLFADLVSRAVNEKWGREEFLDALSSSKQFNRLFPGADYLIIEKGMSVPEAIRFWRNMTTSYEEELRNAGLWGFAKAKMSKQNIGLAIQMGLDPEELVARFSIAEQAMRSEPLRQAFNQILKGRQQAQLDRRGWLRFLLGKGDAQLYDIYEGAQLLQVYGPEGLKAKEARRLARAFGEPGQQVDVTDAIENINRIRSTIGSTVLEAAGLDAGDLALAALSDSLTGRTPKLRAKAAGIVSQLEQMVANAQAEDADQQATFIQNNRPISASAPQQL